MTKIINLFGGPGVGKSTAAAGLFHLLKTKGIRAELVTEYAKEKVWEDNIHTLDNQLYILAKQENKLRRLIGKVDYVVSDSPILCAEFYLKGGALDYEIVKDITYRLFREYNNVNFLISRTKNYVADGRLQTEEGANNMHQHIELYLSSHNISFEYISGDVGAPKAIAQNLGDF